MMPSLIQDMPMPEDPGYTPNHEYYQSTLERFRKMAYAVFNNFVGSVSVKFTQQKGSKDVLIAVCDGAVHRILADG
jgi:hypothetical protein